MSHFLNVPNGSKVFRRVARALFKCRQRIREVVVRTVKPSRLSLPSPIILIRDRDIHEPNVRQSLLWGLTSLSWHTAPHHIGKPAIDHSNIAGETGHHLSAVILKTDRDRESLQTEFSSHRANRKQSDCGVCAGKVNV
jgi:hypothetical protein